MDRTRINHDTCGLYEYTATRAREHVVGLGNRSHRRRLATEGFRHACPKHGLRRLIVGHFGEETPPECEDDPTSNLRDSPSPTQ